MSNNDGGFNHRVINSSLVGYDDCFEFEKELSALLARYSASGIMFVNVRGGVVVPLGESE